MTGQKSVLLAGDRRDLLGTAVDGGAVAHEVVAVLYDAVTDTTRLDYAAVPLLLDQQTVDLAGGPTWT